MTAVLYVATRFYNRVVEFLRDWYVGSFWMIAHAGLTEFEYLDRSLALRVNVTHIFQPLFQDRSVIGHTLGFLFRSARIAFALIIYLFVGAVFVIAYVFWALIPIILLYSIFTNHVIV